METFAVLKKWEEDNGEIQVKVERVFDSFDLINTYMVNKITDILRTNCNIELPIDVQQKIRDRGYFRFDLCDMNILYVCGKLVSIICGERIEYMIAENRVESSL